MEGLCPIKEAAMKCSVRPYMQVVFIYPNLLLLHSDKELYVPVKTENTFE